MELIIGAMIGVTITVAAFYSVLQNLTTWGSLQLLYNQLEEKENRKKDKLIRRQLLLIEEQNNLLQRICNQHH